MAPNMLKVFCWAVLRLAPVIFIVGVIVWSYYAYVVQTCIFTVSNVAEKVIYLIIYHPLLAMMLWCYGMTIFTETAYVPPQFFLPDVELDRYEKETDRNRRQELLQQFARNLPVQCRTVTGAIRYCDVCKCVKPDRAHHCSMCSKCILKMDHHCPWVDNCVSFSNYKFFVLFLAYAMLYSTFVMATCMQYFVRFWMVLADVMETTLNVNIVVLTLISFAFVVGLACLFTYHCYLIAHNRSTFESFRSPIFRSGPDRDGFNFGAYKNFIEVFGKQKLYWFLPIASSQGDGYTFFTRISPPPTSYHSMEVTTASVQPHNARYNTADEESLIGDKQLQSEDTDMSQPLVTAGHMSERRLK